MSELRGILLLVGALLVAGIYGWGRWRAQRKAPLFKPHLRRFFADKSDDEDLPSVRADDDNADAEDFGEDIADDIEESAEIIEEKTDYEPPESGSEQKIVSLRIVAHEGMAFSGFDLLNIFNEEGLEFGEFDIFHKLVRGERERPLFSIASLHEPGSFDIKHLGDQKVTGVLVFMVLPGPQDGGSTFSDMIDTSRRIAATLGGELRDDQGSTFNSQRERSIREEIIEYQYLATIERGNAGA
ncbi:MAG: cell division protein ZipA C-terminal FtsZ-binding domain-containing protein [Gammaproteobacteria bacterium]